MVTDDDHVPVPPPVAPPPPASSATAHDEPPQDAEPPQGAERPALPRERAASAIAGLRAGLVRAGGAARRNVGWIAVGALATIAIVALVSMRVVPDADAQTSQSVTAWDAGVASYAAGVQTVTVQASQVDAARVGESGLANGDVLQQGGEGIDLSAITWGCAGVDATVSLAAASADLAAPVLGPGDPDDFRYEEALGERDAFASAFTAASTYADDVGALDGDLAAACGLADRLEGPVRTLGYQDVGVDVGELAQVGQTTTVVCAGPYGCPNGPGASPTWDWGYLADLHGELADAFEGSCPADLEASCALAVAALDQLVADDDVVLEAWAVANDDDATAAELQTLQTALDDRASRFDAAWAEVQEAAPGGSLEGALAQHVTDGFGQLSELVAGIQLGDRY